MLYENSLLHYIKPILNKELIELDNFFYETQYLCEYQHISETENIAASIIADIVFEDHEKRRGKNPKEFDDSEPMYTGIIYNEDNDRANVFYREEPYSGKHHRIMLKYSNIKNGLVRTQMIGPNIITDYDKKEIYYDENGDITIVVNSNIYIYHSELKSRREILSQIAHELNHITHVYFNKSIYVLGSATTKMSLYTDCVESEKLFQGYKGYWYVRETLYLFSPLELTARLKQIETFIRSCCSDVVYKKENLHIDFVKYFKNTTTKQIDKYSLIDIVFREPYIKMSSQLGAMYNSINNFDKQIHSFDTQKTLLLIGYFLKKHRMLKFDLRNTKSPNHKNYTKFLKIDTLKEILSSDENPYDNDIFFLELIIFIVASLVKLFNDFQWKIYNMIDSYLPKLFDCENITNSKILIHTILQKDFKLKQYDVDLLNEMLFLRRLHKDVCPICEGFPANVVYEDFDTLEYCNKTIEEIFNKKERL